MIGLRWWRRARGWTQAELAEVSGVDRSQISEIERGEVGEPRPATLRRLAVALGVEPFDLLVGRDALVYFGAPEALVRGTSWPFTYTSPQNADPRKAPRTIPTRPPSGVGPMRA